MKSKEILESQLNIKRLTPIQFDGIMRAMEIFAEQEAQEFHKWAYIHNWHYDWMQSTWIKKSLNDFGELTEYKDTDQLFDIYLKQK